LTPVGVTVALPGLVDISKGVLFVGPDEKTLENAVPRG